MLVMKFGGASVKDAEAIRNVAHIILHHKEEPCLIVISASGKTTNHLETLSELARTGQADAAKKQFEFIKSYHLEIVQQLWEADSPEVVEALAPFFGEILRLIEGILLLEEFSNRTYDRIVAFGELLSTTIVAAYLRHVGEDCQWLDARKIIKTDATYKRASVIWSLTQNNISQGVTPLMGPGKILITQGFIASTLDGKTTTLGREGSDYTASIFANCLDARQLIVWKDVPGVLNGDPRIRENTVKIDNLTYEEAVEMTFYGASVIHPNTIKPLFNKQIPLFVKCFHDIQLPGTCISDRTNPETITSFIRKKHQTFVKIQPRDFSFMDEQQMEVIFNHVYKTGVKVNLVQNTAISLMLCIDHEDKRMEAFESLLLDRFVVELKSGLILHTIIHFSIKDLKLADGAEMVQKSGNKLFIVKHPDA